MTVKAWSYSRWAAWELCPRKFFYQFVEKRPQPESPAMAKGSAAHSATAAYITGTGPFPAVAEKFKTLLTQLHDMPAEYKFVEQQWGFTAEWKPTGWFGDDTWFRAIVDAGAMYDDLTVDIIDHKTGKKYGTHTDEMELFAISAMSRYKPARHVTTRLWYFDSGEEEIAEFPRSGLEKLQQKWSTKAAALLSDTVYAPRPNDKCRFCAFSKSKAGPCKFG